MSICKLAVNFLGITEKLVTSTMETMMILEQGSLGRVTGSTAMNQASSRSHAVFTIIIAKESRTDKWVMLVSTPTYQYHDTTVFCPTQGHRCGHTVIAAAVVFGSWSRELYLVRTL